MALIGLWYAGVAALAGRADAAEYWFQLETEREDQTRRSKVLRENRELTRYFVKLSQYNMILSPVAFYWMAAMHFCMNRMPTNEKTPPRKVLSCHCIQQAAGVTILKLNDFITKVNIKLSNLHIFVH